MFRRIGNIMGKVEKGGNQHFLLFPQCLYPIKMNVLGVLVSAWLSVRPSVYLYLNPLPDMPILRSSISAVKNILMSKI